MKKNYLTVATFTLLSLVAVSCQKETEAGQLSTEI